MTNRAYVSWDLSSDDVYNDEGEVIDCVEYVLIEKIEVPVSMRRQGVARKILKEAIADIRKSHNGMTIKIAALPFGEDKIDMTDLVAFYESEGFTVVDTSGHAVIMEMD